MSEVTCNTIKDILPLYVDGVVSDDTRNMVAKHLEHCEECKKKYEAMKSEVVIPVEGSIAPLKHFKNTWKKKKSVQQFSPPLLSYFVLSLSSIILLTKIKSQSMVLYIRKKEKISPHFLPIVQN